MPHSKRHPLELLAPAGTPEAFETAVAAGADAVYIGAPALNARALAKNFSMAEIAAMIDHAHAKGVKVFLAMNSLMKEEEIPRTARTLAMLEALAADGLILQDLGVYRLARKYFPGLRLHASTLLAAHNSMAVRQFARMGFARVVLARELTLEEIGRIRQENPGVEIEVFIHGALCFSYSGLCLFSSFLGGKSGLRGRCVQPCRRRCTWTGKGKGAQSGYFFSLNDLSGLPFLPRLAAAGVTSLKIEGRMRSAHYVGQVVRAYRLALANPHDKAAQAEAQALLDEAMGRRTTGGYFEGPEPRNGFAPQHSGNIGLFLGKVEAGSGGRPQLRLQAALQNGDRLRLHQERTGERLAFTLKGMRQDGRPVDRAGEGAQVELALPPAAEAGDSLYKVDVRESRGSQTGSQLQPERFRRRIARLEEKLDLGRILKETGADSRPAPARRPKPGPKPGPGAQKSPPLPWWLKIDDLRSLAGPLIPPPQRLVLTLTRATYAGFARSGKLLKPYMRRLVWALPPITDEAELPFYEQAVRELLHRGFKAWQLGHLGQLALVAAGGRKGGLELIGGYTLNILNTQALAALRDLGFKQVQVAIETDRANLEQVGRRAGAGLGLTVYATPALFTARPAPGHFRFHQLFVSPKGEKFLLQREDNHTVALPAAPFSLLDFLPELAAAGLDYVVVDLSHMRLRKGDLPVLLRRLAGGGRRDRQETAFNYRGTLL